MYYCVELTYHVRIRIMDRVIFICDDLEKGADIQERLEKSFEVLRKDFCADEIKECIVNKKPLLTIVFIKDMSLDARHVLHFLLSSQSMAFVLIGRREDCQEFFDEGYVVKYIITPLLLKEVIVQIKEAVDFVKGKNQAEQTVVKKDGKMSNKKHILLVDDDIVTLRTLTNYLKDFFDVSVVRTGLAAINFLAKETPDLILLDYEMPGCDGVQTLQMIQKEEAYKDIPVFFLTGVSDAYHVKLAVRLKPEGYILKSISQDELLYKLHDFFK